MLNTEIRNIVTPVINPEAKFEDADVNAELRQAGIDYLTSYDGTFNYLVDLKRRNPAKLSIGQVRGVLNCIRAELLREANGEQDALDMPTVADGRYAVHMDGKLRFFRVNTPAEGRWSGFTFINEHLGDRKASIRNRAEKLAVLTAISNDSEALARFGKELGICGVCGRTLTDEESRELGIGPICRNKMFVV